MKSLLSKIKFIYQYIISSIGFYPTLISLLFFGLSVLLLYLERHGLSEQMLDTAFSFMIITHGETAGLVLSSITTGIISLTVFSFTMVMLVLNQASANFSPRVIPGLITHKANQTVMGLYLGTLIYTLVIMVNVRSDSYTESLPGFAIFLSMCFAIICLAFFVYFIHAISQSIQIGSILQEIYFMTVKSLEHRIEEDSKRKVPNVYQQSEWSDLKSPRTGYLQSIDRNAVVRVCEEFDVVLDFEAPLGSFLVQGVPFARVNKKLSDDGELVERLLDHVNFFREERPDINYVFGFKHITESAVKALSPSINDPGTGVKAIEYLTALFALRMKLPDEHILCDEKGAARIRFQHEAFEDLLRACLSPIRLHGKGDPMIIMQLLAMLKSLLYKAKDFTHLYPVLCREAELILFDAEKEISNYGDRELINKLILQLNEMGTLPQVLPYLKDKA